MRSKMVMIILRPSGVVAKSALRRGSFQLDVSHDLDDVRSFDASMNTVQDQHKSR